MQNRVLYADINVVAKSACVCDDLPTRRLRPSPQTEQERRLEESQDFYPKIMREFGVFT
jgi:hypothetical protein